MKSNEADSTADIVGDRGGDAREQALADLAAAVDRLDDRDAAGPPRPDEVGVGAEAEELGLESGQITLESAELSPSERDRYQRLIALLGVCADAADGDRRAILQDLAALQVLVGDDEAALAAAREAHEAAPGDAGAARSYHLAARRCRAWDDLVAALAAEARCTGSEEARSALLAERGRVLADELDDPAGAEEAYQGAADGAPHLGPMLGLEELARRAGDLAAAADRAAEAAEAAGTPELGAELLARAARHRARSGDAHAGFALAERAARGGSMSTLVAATLERLALAAGELGAIAEVRAWQVDAGQAKATEAWLDVALLARYRLGDDDLAARALRRVLEDAGPDARRLALGELGVLAEARCDWRSVADVLRERALLAGDDVGAAELLARLGDVRAGHLDDVEGALGAYEEALSRDRSCRRALEGAGRLYRKLGRRDELAAMHRGELEAASGPEAAGEAARRLGTLLVETEGALEEGIQLLRQALPVVVGRRAVFDALERALARAGRQGELLELYEAEAAAEDDPQRRAELAERAADVAARALGDRKRAIAILGRIEPVDRKGVPSHLRTLMDLLREDGDWAALAQVLGATLVRHGDEVDRVAMLGELAEAQERAGDAEAAVASYQRAVALAPADHAVFPAAGRVLLDQGRYDELVVLFDRAAEVGDEVRRAFWRTRSAEVLADFLGDPIEAGDRLRETVPVVGDRARRALERVLAVGRRWRELGELLADRGGPADRVVRAALAEARGDLAEARALYGEAVAGGATYARVAWHRLCLETDHPLPADDHPATTFDAVRGALEAVRGGDVALAAARLAGAPGGSSELGVALLGVELAADARARARALGGLDAWPVDDAARAVFRAEQARALEAADEGDEALALRRRMLQAPGWDPVVSADAEIALERLGLRRSLAEVLERCEAPELAPLIDLRLGEIAWQLGSWDEACVHWERAAADEPGARSLRAAIGVVASRARTGDESRRVDALARLAAALPVDWAVAAIQLVLARARLAGGDEDGALAALDDALAAAPAHRGALAALADLTARRGEPERACAPMLRAFDSAEEPARLADLGRLLATRLIAGGTLEPALELAERLLSAAPDDARAQALLHEAHARSGSWQRAADAARMVAENASAPPALRSDAARRAVELLVGELDRADEARAWFAGTELPDDEDDGGWRRLHDAAEIAGLLGDSEAAAEHLAALADHPSIGDGARERYLGRLAEVQERWLDDADAALETLARLGPAAPRAVLVPRLLSLAQGAAEASRAAPALADALAARGPLDVEVELAARRWLVDATGADADCIPHLERVVELDPDDVAALERLASVADSPERALRYQLALLEAQPEAVERHRTVRQLFLELGDEDGAFLAEGVLVGLDMATEEESYFYRQRRAQLKRRPGGGLDSVELVEMAPALDPRLSAVLRELEEVVAEVLPPDLASYGFEEGEVPAGDFAADEFTSVGELLGVDAERYRLCEVTAALPPTVERAADVLVLVPRELNALGRRHKQCVAGALLARLRFHGVLGTPSSSSPISAKQLGYLVRAALSLVRGRDADDASESPIYQDIRRRLDGALGAPARRRLAEVVDRLEVDDAVGERMIAAMNRVSARAAVVAARDAAVAAACFARYPSLVGDPAGERAGPGTLAALAFAVSAAHRSIRDRLAMGVGHG